MNKELSKKAHYHEFEKKRLKKILTSCKNQGLQTILDVGCGTGSFAPIFKEIGLEFTGVDVSAEMIAIAAGNGHNPISIEQLQATSKKFDIILISHVIEHIHFKPLIDFIQFYLDRLNPGGVIILVSPLLVENFYFDFTHERPYYPQSIWQMFGEYKDSLSIEKKALVRLKDIYFIRDCYRTRKWRSYYIQDNTLKSYLTSFINNAHAQLYLLTGSRFGYRTSWIGVYQKINH